MRKSLIVFMTVLIVGGSGLAWAQMNDKNGGMMGNKAGMMGKGMMGGHMGMCPMMKSMMERSVVATSDGGVVIVAGNKITKYDKNLNVVKETELKMDMDGMKKMMKDCPMMGGGKMKDNDGDDDKAEAPAPAAEVDHASHH